MVVEIVHPDARRDKALLDDPAARRAGREPAPAAVVNPDVFATQRRLSAALAARADKDSHTDAFSLSSNWLRLELDTEGMYHLTGADLEAAGISLSGVDPDKVRVFRGGGLTLPEDPEATADGLFPGDSLTEVAVTVRAGDDGEWNLDDDVIFLGFGAATWRDRLDPSAARLDHFEHPHQLRGVYWLTWEDDVTPSAFAAPPRRVASQGALPNEVAPVTTHLARYHGEKNVAPVLGWLEDNWAWDGSVLSQFNKTFILEGVIEGQPAEFFMELTGVRDGTTVPPAFQVSGYFNEDVTGAVVDFSWLLYCAGAAAAAPIRFGGDHRRPAAGTNQVQFATTITRTPATSSPSTCSSWSTRRP